MSGAEQEQAVEAVPVRLGDVAAGVVRWGLMAVAALLVVRFVVALMATEVPVVAPRVTADESGEGRGDDHR